MEQAANKVADSVQGAPAGGGNAGTDSLGDNIKKAAITSNSPAGQIAKVRLIHIVSPLRIACCVHNRKRLRYRLKSQAQLAVQLHAASRTCNLLV